MMNHFSVIMGLCLTTAKCSLKKRFHSWWRWWQWRWPYIMIKKPKKTSATIWLLGVTLVTLDKHQMDSTVWCPPLRWWRWEWWWPMIIDHHIHFVPSPGRDEDQDRHQIWIVMKNILYKAFDTITTWVGWETQIRLMQSSFKINFENNIVKIARFPNLRDTQDPQAGKRLED